VLGALLVVAGAVAGPKILENVRGGSGLVAATPPVSKESEPGSAIAHRVTAPSPTTRPAPPVPAGPKGLKGPEPPSIGSAPATPSATVEPTHGEPTAALAVALAPSAEPPPPVALEPAPVAPTPVAPTTPVPAFNPSACRAQLGATHASGATNAKDLSLNDTAAAWTSCAQQTLRERPSAPIVASVHLIFTDTGSFRGATCAACPPALAQCIAASTGRTVTLASRGSDVPGAPAFDVGTTFTCD
jgi:hypothetical protein